MDIGLLQRTYPHVAAAIAPTAALLANVSKLKGAQNCVLEARVGAFVQDAKPYFKSGVDADTFFISKILCKLETSNAWHSKTEWEEQTDRYYLLPCGLEVRTTTEGVTDPSGAVHCVVSHILASDVGHVDFKWQGGDARSLLTSESGAVMGVRVALKQVEPAFEDELPDRVDDLHIVRIKQRKSFRYVSKHKAAAWTVNVTQIYQAPTYVEALLLLHDGKVSTYELDVECKGPLEHLRTTDMDYNRLAASLLVKMADLFELPKGPRLASTACTLIPQ
jgi:hypothetical protein